jgi:hypothetical protein
MSQTMLSAKVDRSTVTHDVHYVQVTLSGVIGVSSRELRRSQLTLRLG